MRLTALDICIFVTFLLAVLALGLYASRKASGSKRDYFLAGDKLPWWMIGGSIVAANISSHHFVGVMGTAYKLGFVAMSIEWGAILIGFNALLWIFLPFYIRNGFYTMPEFLDRRFGAAARTAYASLIYLTYVFVEISAVLYLGAVAVDSLFGVNPWYSIVGLAAFVGLYTITGGLRAVVWTEMLQLAVLIAGGMALSVATIRAVGGWSGVMATSSKWHLLLPYDDPNFPWTQYLGGTLSISVFYCATNQFMVQRVLAAKNEWHARMGVVLADYLKFFLPLIIIIPGVIAPILLPHLAKPDYAFPTLVRTLLPSGLVGLVMAGLIAAIMSHVSGALNSCTTIATMDFYMPYFGKGQSEKKAIYFGKAVGVVTLLLGILWAGLLTRYSQRPIFIYLADAYGYFAPGIASMFLLGIFWKRATHAGALAAGALTIPLSIVIHEVFPLFPFANRTGVVFWACMMLGIIVSLRTKPKSEEELKGLIWTRESLTLPKEQKSQMRGLRNPVIWWAIVTAAVLFFYIRYH